MEKIKYSVPSIHCNHCKMTIEMELSEIPGVGSVNVDSEAKTVEVSFDNPATEEIIVNTLKEINYPPEIE